MRRTWTYPSVVLLMAVALCATAVTAVAHNPDARGQVAAAKPQAGPDKPKSAATPIYFGVSACIDCHSKGMTNPVLCRCTEVLIWEKDDKHKDAYKVLLGERSNRMGEILGLNPATDRRCVSCHGVHIDDAKLKEESNKVGFKVEEGVSCVACHGAYLEWVEMHGSVVRRPMWRGLSREEKEQKYGMTDLWDPAKRTRMCASCHIGNAAEGKVLTHAMYAAGHPPLPSFEPATFSDAMPRHWEYLREKKPEAQKLLSYDPANLEKTQLVLVGGTVALQETVGLLAGERAGAAGIVDWAQLDCAACHHDLQTRSWRQERGYSSAPGRPGTSTWPMALARAAARSVGEERNLDEPLQRLAASFASRPFGKPNEVQSTAKALAGRLGELTTKLSAMKCDQALARRLLWNLCTLKPDALPDYDSARQIAWAARIVYDDLMPKPANDAAIRKLLDSLDQELRLQLPAGAKQSILQELPLTLQKRADYDAARFQLLLGELARLLPAPR